MSVDFYVWYGPSDDQRYAGTNDPFVITMMAWFCELADIPYEARLPREAPQFPEELKASSAAENQVFVIENELDQLYAGVRRGRPYQVVWTTPDEGSQNAVLFTQISAARQALGDIVKYDLGSPDLALPRIINLYRKVD